MESKDIKTKNPTKKAVEKYGGKTKNKCPKHGCLFEIIQQRRNIGYESSFETMRYLPAANIALSDFP